MARPLGPQSHSCPIDARDGRVPVCQRPSPLGRRARFSREAAVTSLGCISATLVLSAGLAIAIPGVSDGATTRRGAMLSPSPTPADVMELGVLGANIARWQIHLTDPAVADNLSLDEYQRWLSTALGSLDAMLPHLAAAGVVVVIDLHTPPGGSRAGNHHWVADPSAVPHAKRGGRLRHHVASDRGPLPGAPRDLGFRPAERACCREGLRGHLAADRRAHGSGDQDNRWLAADHRRASVPGTRRG